MNWGDFLKPTKKKIILMIIIFVIVRYISFRFGIKLVCGGVINNFQVFDGCGYKLNPLFWLPASIFLDGGYEVTTGVGVPPPFSVYDNMSIILITLPYWLLVSYLFSCLTISGYNKLKKK